MLLRLKYQFGILKFLKRVSIFHSRELWFLSLMLFLSKKSAFLHHFKTAQKPTLQRLGLTTRRTRSAFECKIKFQCKLTEFVCFWGQGGYKEIAYGGSAVAGWPRSRQATGPSPAVCFGRISISNFCPMKTWWIPQVAITRFIDSPPHLIQPNASFRNTAGFYEIRRRPEQQTP